MASRATPKPKTPARAAPAKAVTRSMAKPASKPAPNAAARAVPRPAVAAPVKAASVKAASTKPAKVALVRDSFTMPHDDYALIASLKKRAILSLRPAKKSELLRAGLQALAGQDDAGLKAALDALVVIKAGRPKKH